MHTSVSSIHVTSMYFAHRLCGDRSGSPPFISRTFEEPERGPHKQYKRAQIILQLTSNEFS